MEIFQLIKEEIIKVSLMLLGEFQLKKVLQVFGKVVSQPLPEQWHST